MVEKTLKKTLKKKKMKHIGKLHTFKKMNVHHSKQKSISSNSSRDGEIRKIGSDKVFNLNHNCSSKKKKVFFKYRQ